MANRLYIYSNSQKNADSFVDVIIEANYELPIYFYPLFISKAKLVGSDIFASAPEGVLFFEQFYAFLETHADSLEIKQPLWMTTTKKISVELEKLAKQNWLYLEMSDVLGMSSQPFKLQAEAMLTKIQLSLAVIQDAISANNPSLLDQLIDYHETGVANFKTYLNHEKYEYGWTFFDKQHVVDNGAVPIDHEENGKFGFKTAKGNIITPATYDATYAFDEHTRLCIAEKGGKFVFINIKGQLEFETEFDDLYDFFHNYDENKQVAIAKHNGHYGLINRKGNWVISPQWDDLRGVYERGQFIAAKKGDLWGVIDETGKIIVEQSLPFNPRPNDEHATSYYYCAPEDGEPVLYLSLKWQPFTVKSNIKIESFHARDDLKTVLGKGIEARYGLMNQEGETLLQTIYNEIEFEYGPEIYRIKKDKKYGLFHPLNGWLIDCEFDHLSAVYTLFSGSLYRHGDSNWLARKGKQYGLYDSKKQAWVLVCTQGKITPFAKNVVGVMHALPLDEAGIWVHSASTGAALSGPFESLSDCAGGLEFAAVLGFTQTEVMTIGQTGIVKPITEAHADSLILRMPNEDKYGEYFFTLAQGSLIKKYFSKKFKTNDLIEQGLQFEEKNEYKQAIDVYLQAAKEGNAAGYVNAGFILASQDSLKNPIFARQYYQLAADANEPQGLNNLACCYRDGDGGAQDMAKAIILFKRADEEYNKMATQNLAQIYYDDDALQDHAQALKYFLKCYSEYPRPLELGYLYDTLLNDFVHALKYYQIAAKEGSGYAYNRIGVMWQEGNLGKVDVKMAQEFYQKAINAEYADAHAGLNLAKLLMVSDPVAAKAAWQFAVDHAVAVDGLSAFGREQGWL